MTQQTVFVPALPLMGGTEGLREYCICRTTDESAEMIGCDKCDEWFHFSCVGIDPVINRIK